MDNSFVLNFQSLDLLKDSTTQEEEITYHTLLSDIFPYFSKSQIVAYISLIQILFYSIHLIQYLSQNTLQTQLVTFFSCSQQSLKTYHFHQMFISLFLNTQLNVFLFQLVFNLMVLSFVETRMSKLQFCFYYLGCGYFGNLLTIFFNKYCVSNIGSLALFVVSLKLQHLNFKDDDYIEYQNYNQTLGISLYKFVLFSYVIYQLVQGGKFLSFAMYVGGMVFIVLKEIGGFKMAIAVLVLITLTGFFIYQ